MSGRQYASAGVDLRVADAAKERIARLVAATRTPLALGAVGAFGGMVRVPAGFERPVLVMSTDGVGTKVLVARIAGRLDTVGEDLVNHSVNDILVHGARPIAFQDYIAGAGLSPEAIAELVAGVARGCTRHAMVLSGGETAQMPDLYQPGDFDLAGTIVGVVEEGDALHGDRVRAGDVLVGLAASGLHTNGYTLARRVLLERLGLAIEQVVPDLGRTLAEELLAVHQSYDRALRPVLNRVHGLAHVTGGGIPGNLIRILPPGTEAVVRAGSWTEPPIFDLIRRGGEVAEDEMREVFNLGLGMIVVAPSEAADPVLRAAQDAGVSGWVVGDVRAGGSGVRFA